MTQESDTQPENPLVGVKVVVNILEEGVLIGITRGAVDPHVENCAVSPSDGQAYRGCRLPAKSVSQTKP